MTNYDAGIQREIGQRIRERRKELGISMSELSEMLGYSKITQISKIELGEANVPIDKLYLMGQVLDVPLDYLIYGDQTGIISGEIEDRLSALNERQLRICLDMIDIATDHIVV